MSEHVIDLLDGAARDLPGRVFVTGAGTLTFAEAAAATRAVAAWLGAAGVTAGDRILIVAGNHADVVVAALGAARCGVTFTILHDEITPASFAQVAVQLEPSCLVLDQRTAALAAHAPGLPVLLTGDGGGHASRTPVGALPAAPDETAAAVCSDPLCIVFTSGSTGAPRGVMVSHDNVAFTTGAIQARLDYRASDTVALFLPLSFDYGLYQVFLALRARASLYIAAPGTVPLRAPDALARANVSVLPGVPLLLAALVAMLQRRPLPLPLLRMVTNTGERLPARTIAQLTEILPQAELFVMFGLTECKRVSILLPHERAQRPHSVGRPLDDTTAEVVDADGRPLPAGCCGELVVRGRHVTQGYWRAPEETAARFATTADGQRMLRTGDICRRDDAGFLYFEGRRDAQRKRRGFRISLLEIESVALAVPEVAHAVAVQPLDGDELHLFVTAPPRTVTGDDVLQTLRDRLEPYKVPDRVHVWTELPETPHGKVDRSTLTVAAGSAA